MKKVLALSSLFVVAAVLTPVFGAVASLATVGVMSMLPATGALNSGLNKEVWLAELMEGFYADDSFLSELRDLSAFVENDIINLAEAGVDPDVIINNTTYPIDIADRNDAPIAIEIDRFDTENTQILKADQVELSYDKLSSVMTGHRNALRMKIMEKGVHAIAPASNGTYTPLLTATGADNGSGLKRLTWSDVRKLQTKFDQAEIPAEGRIIIFSSQHLEDLEVEDLDRFNKMMDKGVVCGFKIYTVANKRLPKYNKSTGAKVAFGAAAAPLTDSTATIAFHKAEVARAMGSEDMFHSKAESDPIYRRDVIGFAKRAIVIPIRNKGIAAIYSPAA